MDLFEFVLVCVSLVLAIGITQLLRQVAQILSYRHTLDLSWAPLMWLATMFLYAVAYWWSIWDFRSVEWTFPSYFYLLIFPTLLYIAISLLVSADVSEPGVSLDDAFERIRVPFLSTIIAMQIVGSWDGWMLGVEPFWNSLRAIQVFILIILLVGAASSSQIVWKIVTVMMFVVLAFGMFVLRYLPGAFGAG